MSNIYYTCLILVLLFIVFNLESIEKFKQHLTLFYDVKNSSCYLSYLLAFLTSYIECTYFFALVRNE